MESIVLIKDLGPIAESGLIIQLPVDAWYPYNIDNTVWFVITYIQQVILGSSVICAHVGIDTLFVRLLLNTIAQMSILKYRLLNFVNTVDSNSITKQESRQTTEKKLIFECICHHKRIYRYIIEI